MQEYSVLIYSVLGVVVFTLSIYLGIVLNQLRIQKAIKEKALKEYKQKELERQEYIHDSLRIISLAVVQDQCEISEGCIRIKKLIDEVDMYKEHELLNYFHVAYEDFKQFPFLDERKQLTKQERFKQDNQRFMFEEQHGIGVKSACSELLKLLKENS